MGTQYRCENCGLVMDRDDNSAVNIYERFLARLRATHSPECGVLRDERSNEDICR